MNRFTRAFIALSVVLSMGGYVSLAEANFYPATYAMGWVYFKDYCSGSFVTDTVTVGSDNYTVNCGTEADEAIELMNAVNANVSSPVTADLFGAANSPCDSNPTHISLGGYDVCLTAKVIGQSGNGTLVSVNPVVTDVIEASGPLSGGTDARPLEISRGGTGAETAADARTSLGAAASGPNSDITALSALASLNVSGTVSAGHLKSTGSTPITSIGGGAGTGATATVVGTDAAGQVTVTTGTAPAASTMVVKVTFATAYGVEPHVILVPANGNASELTGPSFVKENGASGAFFKMTSGNTALTASKTYKWNYIVVE
jgi:hypothetical protein